jgi:hypothetical protein
LTQIQAPVTAFAGLGDWASDIDEDLVQGQVVADGILRMNGEN